MRFVDEFYRTYNFANRLQILDALSLTRMTETVYIDCENRDIKGIYGSLWGFGPSASPRAIWYMASLRIFGGLGILGELECLRRLEKLLLTGS